MNPSAVGPPTVELACFGRSPCRCPSLSATRKDKHAAQKGEKRDGSNRGADRRERVSARAASARSTKERERERDREMKKKRGHKRRCTDVFGVSLSLAHCCGIGSAVSGIALFSFLVVVYFAGMLWRAAGARSGAGKKKERSRPYRNKQTNKEREREKDANNSAKSQGDNGGDGGGGSSSDGEKDGGETNGSGSQGNCSSNHCQKDSP